ncbi:MAG: hypothetical protein JSR87_01085 [Proteobacteria bacterium]|nr:hypothetical protein [Pseudomonadota bacterium]MBS0573525.1 hypothetical protein [Pseudomonadota bacterium]
MTTIGHNRGPSLEGGAGWRSHCWRQARAALLPHLPVEVVRTRVRRAAELGLDYRTYAGVRATTGRDLVAVLFSANALRLAGSTTAAPALPPDRAARLARLTGCGRLALVPPRMVAALAADGEGVPLDGVHAAPALLAPDREVRDRLLAARGVLPADGVLLIGDNDLERGWCASGRLAGYLPAGRFFPAG